MQTCAVCFSELAKLQSAAQQSLATWKEGLEYECTKGTISPRLNSGADVAKNRAVATQAKWGAHKREGGLYWATYKVLSTPQLGMANCKVLFVVLCAQEGITFCAPISAQATHLLRLVLSKPITWLDQDQSATCAAVSCFDATRKLQPLHCLAFDWIDMQATVRPARNGVYKSNSAGEINFNADLARPILDGISMEWEALFGTTIINRLK